MLLMFQIYSMDCYLCCQCFSSTRLTAIQVANVLVLLDGLLFMLPMFQFYLMDCYLCCQCFSSTRWTAIYVANVLVLLDGLLFILPMFQLYSMDCYLCCQCYSSTRWTAISGNTGGTPGSALGQMLFSLSSVFSLFFILVKHLTAGHLGHNSCTL